MPLTVARGPYAVHLERRATFASFGLRVRDKAARAFSDASVLLRQRRHDAALAIYLGWVGFGNLGDEAMLAAFQTQRPADRPLSASDYGPWMMRAQSVSRPRPGRVREIVLGGGTLVGLTPWGSRLAALCMLFPDTVRWTVGTGAEHPDELALPDRDTWRRELDLFLESAPSFSRISVRGPRSQRTLAQEGLDVPWVGDPVLLLGPETPSASFEERSLLLTVGAVHGPVRSSLAKLLETLGDTARRLLREGWTVTLAPVSPFDLPVTERLAATAGTSERVHVTGLANQWPRFQALAATHHVGVHLRLHAGVLAAGTFAPFLQLAYLPKCYDFTDSIDHGSRTLPVHSLTPDALIEQITDLADTHDQDQDRLRSAVSTLRDRLHAEFSAVAALID